MGTVTATHLLRTDVSPSGKPSRARLLARLAARRFLFTALAVGVVVGFWWAIIAIYDVKPYFMPGPAATFRTMLDKPGVLFDHATTTLWETTVGTSVAMVFAVVLASAFVSSPAAERALLPLAVTMRSIPIVAVAPLITLIAGRGFATSVVCVTIVSFFPILVTPRAGFVL